MSTSAPTAETTGSLTTLAFWLAASDSCADWSASLTGSAALTSCTGFSTSTALAKVSVLAGTSALEDCSASTGASTLTDCTVLTGASTLADCTVLSGASTLADCAVLTDASTLADCTVLADAGFTFLLALCACIILTYSSCHFRLCLIIGFVLCFFYCICIF